MRTPNGQDEPARQPLERASAAYDEVVSAVNTQFEELLADVYAHGAAKTDRTGTGTASVFGRQIQGCENAGSVTGTMIRGFLTPSSRKGKSDVAPDE